MSVRVLLSQVNSSDAHQFAPITIISISTVCAYTGRNLIMPILSTFPCELFDFNSCLLQNGSEKGTLFGDRLKFELKQP